MRRESPGSDHFKVAEVLTNLAWVHYARGDYERSIELQREALAIQEPRLGPEHVSSAMSRVGIAAGLQELGRCDEAIPIYRRAIADSAAAMGEDHPRLGEPRAQLGACLAERGWLDEAMPMLRQAVKVLSEAGIEGDAPVKARFALAKALWARGEQDQARTEAEAAVASLDGKDPSRADELLVAEIQAWLAAR